MKKLNLGKLKLASEEVLQRSQLAGIYGGNAGSCQWVCTCGNNPPISVWDCSDDPSGICRDVYGTGGQCSRV